MGIELWLPRDAARPEDAVPQPAAAELHPGGAVAAAPAECEGAWRALLGEIETCTACPLHASRTRAVAGVGNRGADLLVIGEAPGAEEDRRGEPFVGRSGRLLDEMLRAIGLDRETVYITNVVKSRPPDNRDPKPDEIAACEGYLSRQIELIRPKVILAVGRIAGQSLLRTTETLGRLRGRWHHYGPRETPLLVTYHPAYLLRKPIGKRDAWADLRQVRDRLREGSP